MFLSMFLLPHRGMPSHPLNRKSNRMTIPVAPALQQSPIWESDAFGRQAYSEFLTSYLVSQTTSPTGEVQRPFCMALDANWGAGKTFMVTNWCRQLNEQTQHPAFRFDAWSTDFHTDPLVAFMAAFKKALDNEVKKLPTLEGAKSKATRLVRKATTTLGQIAAPFAKDVALSAAKAVLPGTVSAIADAIQGNGFSINSLDTGVIEAAVIKDAKESAKKHFEKVLNAQVEREALLNSFREDVEHALRLLAEHGNRVMPFFVFIDELDRCRPTFAIQLLENMKHVFNIKGVCFVVSTNLDQLAHSVCAVYGTAFNGKAYLQRFFDGQCTLPKLPGLRHTENLISRLLKPMNLTFDLGLPQSGFLSPKLDSSPVTAVQWVTQAFALTPRDQERMVMMIQACASSFAQGQVIHLLWLSILCAAKIQSEKLFEFLQDSGPIDASFQATWSEAVPADSTRTFRASMKSGGRISMGERGLELKDIALRYRDLMSKNADKFAREFGDEIHSSMYPESIDLAMLNDMRQMHSSATNRSPVMPHRRYGELVNHAGHLADPNFEVRNHAFGVAKYFP